MCAHRKLHKICYKGNSSLKLILFIYLWLCRVCVAVRASLSLCERGRFSGWPHGRLIAVVSLVAEHQPHGTDSVVMALGLVAPWYVGSSRIRN